jgi:hypothetical protein
MTCSGEQWGGACGIEFSAAELVCASKTTQEKYRLPCTEELFSRCTVLVCRHSEQGLLIVTVVGVTIILVCNKIHLLTEPL